MISICELPVVKEIDLESKRGNIAHSVFCISLNLPWKEGMTHHFSNLNSLSKNIICAQFGGFGEVGVKG